tara:strand:- start:1353 stop:1724 length:372 start_codon:yes stop_codon:yes gene_type:complete
MAKIIEVKLPKEYENSNRYEIFKDLESVAGLATLQKQQIEDLKAEIKLRDSQLQKQRADILKLKSYIGHQNIKIKDLELESDAIEIEVEEVKTSTPNFLPASVKFMEVKQEMPDFGKKNFKEI